MKELVSKRQEILKYLKGLSDRLDFYSSHDPHSLIFFRQTT